MSSPEPDDYTIHSGVPPAARIALRLSAGRTCKYAASARQLSGS